jgi:hypothetical protein
VLKEVRDRSRFVEKLLKESAPSVWERTSMQELALEGIEEEEQEVPYVPREVPYVPREMPKVRSYDYEQLRREHGL